MVTDIHKKPFDSATEIKLKILRNYLREWFPVFFAGKNW